ncbi:MAG: M28 family peptidase [Longimicrobiales bacterium]
MANPSASRIGFRVLGIVLVAGLSASCDDLLGTGGSGTPRILSVAPERDARGVSILATVEIEFSTKLDPSSVAEAVSLRMGEREIRTRIVLENGTTLHLEPTDPLDFGASYRAVVKEGLRSSSGRNFAGSESWTFSTEGEAVPAPNLDSMRVTLAALAHDSMRGRRSGSEDELRAALFLMDRFAAYGLDPSPAGSLQPFQAKSRKTHALVSSQNVLTVIRGTGRLAQEWVVVGAHYDHIGLREDAGGGLEVNNGADDNASGTSLILEMARIFRGYVGSGGITTPDRRSVLFAAFGAEEEGLLGSCHLASESPAVPIESTRAMMNFDMVGRLRGEILQVMGLESSSEWANMVVNANSPELILVDPPPCPACSDFACFRDRGVPYIWLHTGQHEQYHTPADDPDLINLPGLVEIGEVALRLLTRLVVMPKGPGISR